MLLLKTWRDMLARKGQFTALILLVALGISIYSGFVGTALDLEGAADRANEDFLFADFETRVVAAPADAEERIGRIDGVEAVEGRLVLDTGLDADGEEMAARVIGIPADEHPAVFDVDVVKGSYLDPGEPDGVLVQNASAKARGIGVGEHITIRAAGKDKRLEVTGIVSAAEFFFLRRAKEEIPNPEKVAVLWADEEMLEEAFGTPGVRNSFAVRIEEGAEREEVIADVEAELAENRVLSSTVREDQPSNFGMREEIRQNQTMAGLMPALVLGVSAMALAIAMARLVQSQRGEIGLSKALGYTDGQILAQYLGFGLIIGLVGSGLGIGLGQLIAYGLGQTYQFYLNLPSLQTGWHPGVVAASVAISVAVCLLASIAPAVRSARLAPAKAMHADPNLSQTTGRIPLVERMLGWAMPRSIAFRLPLRNVFRSRRRSVYTVVGTVFALILIVSMWAMNDSIYYLIDAQFAKVDLWGAAVTFNGNVPEEEAADLAGVRGVTEVDTALSIPVKLRVGDEEREVPLTAIDRGADFHGFTVAAGSPVNRTLGGEGLVFPESLAERMGVGLGDAVEVESPYLDDPVTLKVRTLTTEYLGSPLFVGRQVGQRLSGSDEELANVAYLRYADVDGDELERELYARPGVANVLVKQTLVDMLAAQMGFARFFIGVMFAFAFAVAFVVIYNTFTTNVIERTREIATMRTIGEDRWHMAWMITAENLLLAVVSVPIGVYLGIRAAEGMFAELSTEAYTMPAYISPDSYWLIAVSVLAILLLSEIPPILRVFRLDLAEATKVME